MTGIGNIVQTLADQQNELNRSLTALLHQLKFDEDTFNNTDQLQYALELTSTDNASRRKVFFTGIGKNVSIAEKTANTFRSLNFDAHAVSAVDAMHGDLGMIRDGDVVVALSKSGNTAELAHFLKYIDRNRAAITTFGIQISNPGLSKFDEHCDFVIKLPEIQESNELGAPTNSLVLMQMYLDAIALSLIAIDKDKFKLSHPGGSLGEGKDDE